MSLSKFVKLNLSILKEFKKFHVPLKILSEIIGKAINKKVSVSSLAVDVSRLNSSSTKSTSANFNIEKKISERFVDKNAKLIFGAQKEIVKVTMGNVTKDEERTIDWICLTQNENISS